MYKLRFELGRYANTGIAYYKAVCGCGWKGTRSSTPGVARHEGESHYKRAHGKGGSK